MVSSNNKNNRTSTGTKLFPVASNFVVKGLVICAFISEANSVSSLRGAKTKSYYKNMFFEVHLACPHAYFLPGKLPRWLFLLWRNANFPSDSAIVMLFSVASQKYAFILFVVFFFFTISLAHEHTFHSQTNIREQCHEFSAINWICTGNDLYWVVVKDFTFFSLCEFKISPKS